MNANELGIVGRNKLTFVAVRLSLDIDRGKQ